MVSPPGVLLTARRGVGHAQISPVAYVFQSLAVEVHTGPSSFVTLADIPLVTNVARRELPFLLLLASLAGLGVRAGGLRLGGLAFQVRPRPYEVIPISG